MLIALQHYRLQVENLDQIIMVVKNWHNDRQLNCTPTVVLEDYMKVKCFLAKENYDLIKEIGSFE
jgi:hypothetical protein